MQKITGETFDKLAAKENFRKGKSKDVQSILGLEVGEGLVIFNDEWHIKTSPLGVVSNYAARMEREYQSKTLADGSGWAVLRTK